jgi:hypothetical protein
MNAEKERDEEVTQEIVLHPGDCFGWYSHVSADCHPTSCLKSEWCKSYTINRANNSENSIKKDLDEIGKDSSERITEKRVSEKETQKNMADLGKQAFFDKIVHIAADYVKHDTINYSPKKDNASLKVGGRVSAFLSRKRNEVVFELGGRNRGGPTYRVPFGENVDSVKSEIEQFIEENS